MSGQRVSGRRETDDNFSKKVEEDLKGEDKLLRGVACLMLQSKEAIKIKSIEVRERRESLLEIRKEMSDF